MGVVRPGWVRLPYFVGGMVSEHTGKFDELRWDAICVQTREDGVDFPERSRPSMTMRFVTIVVRVNRACLGKNADGGPVTTALELGNLEHILWATVRGRWTESWLAVTRSLSLHYTFPTRQFETI
jgi:hypothetical protein